MIDFSSVSGFEWDTGNSDKNWKRHKVSNGECEEVFFNLPLLVEHDPKHSQVENRYYVLGQTNSGRRLFVVFTLRGDQIRIVSARDMSRRERKIYDEQATP